MSGPSSSIPQKFQASLAQPPSLALGYLLAGNDALLTLSELPSCSCFLFTKRPSALCSSGAQPCVELVVIGQWSASRLSCAFCNVWSYFFVSMGIPCPHGTAASHCRPLKRRRTLLSPSSAGQCHGPAMRYRRPTLAMGLHDGYDSTPAAPNLPIPPHAARCPFCPTQPSRFSNGQGQLPTAMHTRHCLSRWPVQQSNGALHDSAFQSIAPLAFLAARAAPTQPSWRTSTKKLSTHRVAMEQGHRFGRNYMALSIEPTHLLETFAAFCSRPESR